MSQSVSSRPVTAVIVTYHSARTIDKTLAAARRCYDANLLDVIIVDNNSGDASAEIIGRETNWAQVILSGKNNGFGRGCNIGFARVNSPYTIFINPDAQVEPDTMRAMLEFMEQNPNAGIVGPATACGEDEGNKSYQHTGLRPTPVTILRSCIPFLRRPSLSWVVRPGSAPARTGWVCGAVLMIRTDLLRSLGGFDPRFFLYWEETDLCKRVEDAGFGNWVIGNALARHIVGASSTGGVVRYGGAVARHYYQSRYYYMVKHHGWWTATIADVTEFLYCGMQAMWDILRGRNTQRIQQRLQAPLFSMPERQTDED